MLYKLNLVTLSILVVSTNVMAIDFSVKQANYAAVNIAAYECKRCIDNDLYQGHVSVSSDANSIDDIHAGNQLGTADNGPIGAISGNVIYQSEDGYYSSIKAHQLGFDNSYLIASIRKYDDYDFSLDYSSIETYNAKLLGDEYLIDDNVTELGVKRNKAVVSFDKKIGVFDSFIRYSGEKKSGKSKGSVLLPTVNNIANDIKSTTQQWDLGVSFNNGSWNSEISYNGNFYNNGVRDQYYPSLGGVLAKSPDSRAHRFTLASNYRLNATTLSGYAAIGRILQDDDLIQVKGNPLEYWEGEVDTLDARIAVNSMINRRWRVGGSIDYSDRDNKSVIESFPQYSFNHLSGQFRQNRPQDISKTTSEIHTSYKISKTYGLQAGLEHDEIERSHSDREENVEDTLWMKLNLRALDVLTVKLNAEHSNRDGSEYGSNKMTSYEENPLMRKFYLSNRTRNEFKLQAYYAPADWLNVDFSTRYANSQYEETSIGLKEAKDFGYDLNVSAQLSKYFNLYGFSSQQWIESTQYGSDDYSSPNWMADIEDEFINFGVGVNYFGLMQGKLRLGADYQFSNSISETYLTADEYIPYDDYFSYSHSAKVFADYKFSADMAVKISYRYERYFDTDPSIVGVNAIPGLVTLGDINHDYNAHQVMLSFTYQLD
ncbi:MtrB/PioB family decaheme-associated outer membrane protein [Shewanella colwelliana]|uniref:MtrB/PioB family decaheme-associated outer membrane protein n=1 Tax=Shewanella colwelliana TaxID=23 RepID=UPI00048FBF68|nr:MtrB/PioB family decaheme-associated outer membrane protein [Shewanella colwelliana]